MRTPIDPGRDSIEKSVCIVMNEPRSKTRPILSFGPQDLEGVTLPHNNALVIKVIVANFDVARVFVMREVQLIFFFGYLLSRWE